MDARLPSSRTLIGFGLASLLLFGCTEARITGIYKETESTDTAVTTPNTAPDCALLEPEDRSSGPEGATVFLTGTATDDTTYPSCSAAFAAADGVARSDCPAGCARPSWAPRNTLAIRNAGSSETRRNAGRWLLMESTPYIWN